MKKRIVWLVVSCLMVVALVLASCAPAVTEEEEVAPAIEEPRYGGWFNLATSTTINHFDEAVGGGHGQPPSLLKAH